MKMLNVLSSESCLILRCLIEIIITSANLSKGSPDSIILKVDIHIRSVFGVIILKIYILREAIPMKNTLATCTSVKGTVNKQFAVFRGL